MAHSPPHLSLPLLFILKLYVMAEQIWYTIVFVALTVLLFISGIGELAALGVLTGMVSIWFIGDLCKAIDTKHRV